MPIFTSAHLHELPVSPTLPALRQRWMENARSALTLEKSTDNSTFGIPDKAGEIGDLVAGIRQRFECLQGIFQ